MLRNTSALLLTLLIMGQVHADPDRPNILWLSTEDISAHLGCYGDPDAITPTLDALAAKGLRYANAFTTAPVCAPNRSAIITGMYQMSIGTHHMRSGGEGTAGSVEPKLPPEIVPFPILLREAGYYVTNASKEDYNFKTTHSIWDASNKTAHWKNRDSKDTPFFAVFNYTNTHEGSVRSNATEFAEKTAPLTDAQRRDPAKLSVPSYHVDTPVVRRQWANLHELVTGLDYWVADHLAALDDAGVADNTIVVFWSDHGTGLPRHKRWLYDSGVKVPLIVYVPEKWQAKYGVEPGTVVNNLVSTVDLAPTTLNMLGLDIPEIMQGQPFLGDDLPEARKYVFGGRDRMDERYDMIRFIRDDRFKMIINFQPWKPAVQFMNSSEKSPVMQEMYRSAKEGSFNPDQSWVIRNPKPRVEFYDIANDPDEIYNLLDSSGASVLEFDIYDKTRSAMFETLLHWQEDINDLGLIPEPELSRLEERYGSRYHAMDKLNEAMPGFERRLLIMLPVAPGPSLASYPGNRNMANQYESLGNIWAKAMETPFVPLRYRAVIGAGQLKILHPLLFKGLRDDAPEVQIAAAQALTRFPEYREAAIDTLSSHAASNEEWVRLYAVTALDEIGELARPALPALKEALNDTQNKYVVRVANRAVNALEGTTNTVR